jgi:hypothetical protein
MAAVGMSRTGIERLSTFLDALDKVGAMNCSTV